MHFKSFGGAMTIPLDEGFTVVTGPNGSGKSNILDGVLFCLGLATSRGMRADRLPDLVNSGKLRTGKAAETVVKVRFDLEGWTPDISEDGLEEATEGPWIKKGQKEWTVTRRLRIMPGGSYSSSYLADGEPCNLQQLQTQLRRLRIDPEGSNVVMQGDVTRIVSMSNRDRRGLIDELAGVALFDNRIEQTRSKLDAVYEKQERCRIVEQELLSARNRLERDCAKARSYQALRDRLNIYREYELILDYENDNKKLENLKHKEIKLRDKEIIDSKALKESETKILESSKKLKALQDNVKALGESKLLSIQGELAGAESQLRELERQSANHKIEAENLKINRESILKKRHDIQEEQKNNSLKIDTEELKIAEQSCIDAEAAVEITRRRLGEVAGRSGEWLEHERKKSNLRQEKQNQLRPLIHQQQSIKDSLLGIETVEKQLRADEDNDKKENQSIVNQLSKLDDQWDKLVVEIENKNNNLLDIVNTYNLQQNTRIRLEQEQARLEKDIAKLESRKETLQESRGFAALRLLLESGLEGIHGPVAQLGEVKDAHLLALEVAAGSRLSHVVVDNDRIAAKAIEILKKRRAGRLTFLPLNCIKGHGAFNKALQRQYKINSSNDMEGLIGKAIDLVSFPNTYEKVFSYVFGETLVFSNLQAARLQLGTNRLVTLEGELLEKSGAMTGGSLLGRNLGMTFGTNNERDEMEPIRERLLELGETLVKCRIEETRLGKIIEELKPELSQLQQKQAALDAERVTAKKASQPLLDRLQERCNRLKELEGKRKDYDKKLHSISSLITPLKFDLDKLENVDNSIDKNKNTDNWRNLESELVNADKALSISRKNRDELISGNRERELLLERLEGQLKGLINEENRLQESIKLLAKSHSEWRDQQKNVQNRISELSVKEKELQEKFGEERRARDLAEADVANQRSQLQESSWQLDRLREDIISLTEEIRLSSIRLEELDKKLPRPSPIVPENIRETGLLGLRIELEKIQKKMEDLEPVNMLALEELHKLEIRLGDLGKRLETLSDERSELLLRIENVATLRQRAFMEAFEAVDKHFREIFASLSEGDGHLQLDNSEDPLEGGLTLVAHPKGKPVRRLAAMSGGEKSLTALSFLFALQRFRPSPFYALDEVDSFLDGVNVERLAALIAKQAEKAQFLVVSHRRPMIGASTRTIGVTQARGAHTQVVGLPDAA